MAMIGKFGLCSKQSYDNLAELIGSNQVQDAKTIVALLQNEMECSAAKLENDSCSGEVFLALFPYFETTLGKNIRINMQLNEVRKVWCDITGDYDVIAFFEQEKMQLSSVGDTIDYATVSQCTNDFFGIDYGIAGEIACKAFLNNINKIDGNTVLIFRLY